MKNINNECPYMKKKKTRHLRNRRHIGYLIITKVTEGGGGLIES